MATTDTLNVKLTADTDGFKSKMSQAEKSTKYFGNAAKDSKKQLDDFGKSTKEASREIDDFADKSEKAARRTNTAFSDLKSAIAALGLGSILKTSLTDAMGAIESESLFGVSMGKYVGEARAWSEQLSKSLSLNPYTLRQSVSSLQNMITTMGIADDSAYKMSTSLSQLAGDMASFYNISYDEAFAKIKSGLIGETEPLRALGIVLNAAKLEQEAYRLGIAKTGEQLNEQQKTLASYSLIMQQTEKAHGDLARTINSPANQLRATMNDLKLVSIEFGMALMPVIQTGLPILRGVIEDIKPVAVDVAAGISYLSSGLELLESPAVRTVAYVIALSEAMNRLRFSSSKTLTAVTLVMGGLSWLAGKFGDVEKETTDNISELGEKSIAITDGAKNSAEDLGDEYKKTGDKIKGALASFDEITKLSGGTTSLVSNTDVQNAADINSELSRADDIINEIHNRMNELFGKNYSVNASISDIGLPDVNWDVVLNNFKDWVSKQDWRGAWLEVGTSFELVFKTALAGIDGLFGTHLSDWFKETTDFFFDYGVKLQIAADPSDEGLKALDKYKKEHGSSAWSDFYSLYQSGTDPKTAFNQVYSSPNLKKGFLAANAELASYYVDEWAGLNKTEIAKLLEDNPRAEDMVAQSFRVDDKSFMGIEGGLKSWAYNTFADYRPQTINVMDGFAMPQVVMPVEKESALNFPISINDGGGKIEAPATASDIYSIMQSLVPSSNMVGPIQLNLAVELDGEKVGAIMSTYNHDQISITNGKQ